MKKLLLFIALAGLTLLAKAQSTDYKPFKFDIGLGYAAPTSGTGTKAGFNFTLEPHYRLSDAFAVGLRVEGAGLIHNLNDDNNTDKASILASYCATAEYYLMDGGFRPFAGGGVGVFSQSELTEDDNSNVTTVPGLTKFGFFPRVGFEAGHFRFAVAYNVIGNDAAGSSLNYFSVGVGAFFGGGKK